MKTLLKNSLAKSIDYQSYRDLIDRLMTENKTTGNNHSESMLHYTKMNVHRMKRLDKTFRLSDSLQESISQLDRDYIWLVITEAWCGDAAQIIPIMNRISTVSEHVELSLVLRDENLELMDQYLTDGSMSIPKLIILDKETGEEVGTWGPRPEEAQQMVMDYKAMENKPPYSEFSKDLQLWYTRDRAARIQEELSETISKLGQQVQPQAV